ncbi:MAG: hypothetical protein KBT47_06295, partial [Armatimonadetes bacterium]|nr:hypothetical protein [Candidatus Hippobium faecium]
MKKDKKYYTLALCVAGAVVVLFVISLIGYNYYRNILNENMKIRDKNSRQLSELNDKIEFTQTKEGSLALLRNEGYVQKNENLIKLKKNTSPIVPSENLEKSGKLACDKHKEGDIYKFDEYCIE